MFITDVAAFCAEDIYMCATLITLLHQTHPQRITIGEGYNFGSMKTLDTMKVNKVG
jgi:hypothetical protein